VGAAEEAAAILADQGVDATVWDVRVAKPLDRDMLVDASTHPLVVTVEDGIIRGGVGSQVVEGMAGLDESRRVPATLTLGLPDAFIAHGKADHILVDLGLDPSGIASAIAKTLITV
jgi:1-deoxy-D-xylulose-5-phosphate synthase